MEKLVKTLQTMSSSFLCSGGQAVIIIIITIIIWAKLLNDLICFTGCYEPEEIRELMREGQTDLCVSTIKLGTIRSSLNI